jgi:hypothetical protein
MSTKSLLRADLVAKDRKTLAEDRKRMERLGKGGQLDDWLAFGPGLLIRRRLAKNIAGLAETDPAKGRRYSRAFKEQMEMDGLYDRTTNAKSDVMKSTFTAVLWFYDDEKLEERRREILEEIRRNMTPGQRARFNSPISAQQRVLDELRTRGLAPAKKLRAPKPANDLDQANARIVELEEELESARSIAPVTDIAEHAAEPTDPVVATVDLQAYLEKRVNADGPSIPSTGSPSSADPAPSGSAEPLALRCATGDGNYEAFKSRWVQYCEADFAALPAAMQTRFVTEVLGMSVPYGGTSRRVSPPPPPFSVELAAMMRGL